MYYIYKILGTDEFTREEVEKFGLICAQNLHEATDALFADYGKSITQIYFLREALVEGGAEVKCIELEEICDTLEQYVPGLFEKGEPDS